jgi:hypothetical protein
MVPETPNHLVEAGLEERGRAVLCKIRGVEGVAYLVMYMWIMFCCCCCCCLSQVDPAYISSQCHETAAAAAAA